MARGMSRLGWLVSSPRRAAASKPAKDRNPNTTPRKIADSGVPYGRLKIDQLTPSLPGPRMAGQLGEDDHDDDDDQGDGDALGGEQQPGAAAGRRDRDPPDQRQPDRAEQEAGPGRRVLPDPERVQEVGGEPAACHRRGHGVEDV